MIIKQINWEQIFSIWHDELWVGRKTEIKPTNGLKLLGGFDKNIEDNISTFFGLFNNDELIGVNSGHTTIDNKYRSRGLFVKSEWRLLGASQLLLQAVEDQAKKESKNLLWSMPRKSSLAAYKKFGFILVSDVVDSMEFGPNYYVIKHI